jgi:hypothetical protein
MGMLLLQFKSRSCTSSAPPPRVLTLSISVCSRAQTLAVLLLPGRMRALAFLYSAHTWAGRSGQ